MLLRCFKNRVRVLAYYLLAALTFSLAMAADPPAAGGPSYVALEPTFTLNYGNLNRTHYLQAGITLRVRDQAAALEVTVHSDAIRHAVIMLFSRQPEEKIRSSAGRDQILEQALRDLQDLMLKETGASLIDRVLFTSWVVQS